MSASNDEFQKIDCPRAGLLRRMAALLYDVFLVAAIWMLLGYTFQLFTGVENTQIIDGKVVTNPNVDNLLFSLMLLSCVAFYCWFWLKSGQTLGMLAWRLRLETLGANTLNLRQALIRWCAAWPSFLFFGIGYIWIFIDKNGDALHDKISNTKVILLPKSERPL